MTWGLLIQKTRVERIRQEWAKQQKAGRIPQEPKHEFKDEEGKAFVRSLGFIDGSAKAKTGK
jgi:hypothetical protein